MSNSRRLAVPAVLTTAALLCAGASGALAASKGSWQATVGSFKTKKAASAEVTKLSGKGFKGYHVETEKKGSKSKKFEVEKGYSSKKAATTAVKTLHKGGFKGAAVEKETSKA
jgi:sporulation related protein